MPRASFDRSHQLTGGYRNIAVTFGTNHPCGNDPGRVPRRMRAHVDAMAQAHPQCLPVDADNPCMQDPANGCATCAAAPFEIRCATCTNTAHVINVDGRASVLNC